LEVVEQLTGLGRVVQSAHRLRALLLLSYELAGAFDPGVKYRECTLIHDNEPRCACIRSFATDARLRVVRHGLDTIWTIQITANLQRECGTSDGIKRSDSKRFRGGAR
jgi:hypothetical protein